MPLNPDEIQREIDRMWEETENAPSVIFARSNPPPYMTPPEPTGHVRDAGAPESAPYTLKPYLEISALPIDWIWRNYVPAGMLSVLDGDPGLGKSTLTLDIASRITRGDQMPDGTPGREPRDVILLSAEDDSARTIRPRLDLAGADFGRVHELTIDGSGVEAFELVERHLALLEAAIVEKDALLVVVDPLMAFLPGTVNAHKDQDVRKVLALLKGVAERTGAGILVVRHLNKMAGASPIYRGGGSIGIIGAARSGLFVAKDPRDEGRRVFGVIKSNIAAKPACLAYRLVSVPGQDHAQIEWDGSTEQGIEELFEAPTSSEDRSALTEAIEFLRNILGDGPVPVLDVRAEAKENGVASRTLDRAKRTLGVVANRDGFGSGSRSVWSLPGA